MGQAQKFQKSMSEQWCLRFKTKHPDKDNYDGVVMLIKPTFIALCVERDFEFDGIVILPKKVIKGCRDNKFDKCRNQIICQNGALKKVKIPSWLTNCETLPEVLTEMMERGIWPAVEHIASGESESAFYIGPINDTAKDGFYHYCYDAAGKWEKEYYLSYKNVFRIEFNSKYCKHFNQYMRSQLNT